MHVVFILFAALKSITYTTDVGGGVLMEQAQTRTAVCVAGSPGLLGSHRISFGLLKHCVRVGEAFGVHRVAARMQKEP